MAATACGVGIDPFTATFDANGGEGGGSIQVPAGEVLVAPEVTRTGYTLAGWLPEVPATMPPSNMTYVAQWESPPDVPPIVPAAPGTYKVKFNKTLGGVKGKMKVQTFEYNKAKQLRKNKFTKKGYNFGGWAKSKALAKKGTIAYNDQQKVIKLARKGCTVTLYAVWGKPYKVKFYRNGGSGKMKTQSFKYGKAKRLRKNKFKRNGYVFKGWATKKHGKVKYKDRKKVKNLTNKGKTIRLYAVWKKK
jgi:uncharacterized repeat protein (TIGR02543 family)